MQRRPGRTITPPTWPSRPVRSNRSRRSFCLPPTFTPLRWSERGMSPMSPTAPANRRYALRTGARSPFRRRRGGRAFIVWRFLTGRWTGLSARWNAPCGLAGGSPSRRRTACCCPSSMRRLWPPRITAATIFVPPRWSGRTGRRTRWRIPPVCTGRSSFLCPPGRTG